MATVQVLPNSGTSSKKQEHLQAGKRRLEEFRKKKAAERAKKAASASQPADTALNESHSTESEHVRLTYSDGAGTSNGVSGVIGEPPNIVLNNEIKTNEIVPKSNLGNYPFSKDYSEYSAEPVQTLGRDEEFIGVNGPVYVNDSGQLNGMDDKYNYDPGTSGRLADSVAANNNAIFHQPAVEDISSTSSQYSYYLSDKAHSNYADGHLKDFPVVDPATSDVLISNASPEISGSNRMQNRRANDDQIASPLTSSLYEGFAKGISSVADSSSEVGQNSDGLPAFNRFSIPHVDKRNRSSSVLTSSSSPNLWPSDSRSMGFSYDVRSSSTVLPLSPALATTNTRRSRPSFLDSINMSKVSSASLPEPEKADSFSSKIHPMDGMAPSDSQNFFNSEVAAGNGGDSFGHGVGVHNIDPRHHYYTAKQDEDFAGLEQHIEDLTQEKFALQRALEASRALAESLASENSALTDTYNQQGSAVHQLKFDMEKLQEEIKAQLVELDSVRIEYANAQLECNAADERAKLLASEVIGLEEKALRIRSSELKMERQLENSQAEISSFRKKVSNLEKERQDLHLTIDALQEEKKLLQSKLRKASSSGKLVDISKSPTDKKSVSTSTEDLVDGDTSNLEMHTTDLTSSDFSSSLPQLDNKQFSLEALSFDIPPDQRRMIQSINTLISELALEKEELVQNLSAESSQSSKLMELNKELSQKLAVQTQRLELLTAQNMANDSTPARQLDSKTIHENTTYADEGDEVVERVLGWIMKLFPGGPSRRRTNKLL